MPPKKSKQPLTDDEKFQLELQAEQELARLQQEYLIMERDKRTETLGGETKMQKVLRIFTREHDNILTDLTVASAPAKKVDDQKVSKHLTRLIGEYDDFHRKVDTQKTYIKEIEGQIKMTQKEVLTLRSQQITERQYEDRVWAAMKTLEALENKVEVQMIKFGTICTKNRLMREQIDHLLHERQTFLKIFDSLIQKLANGKRYMLDLIEQATIAYDQREEWCTKLQALRVKARNEFVQHTQEIREYCRKQDNNQKLEAFFTIKGQKRVMRDLMLKERCKREEHKQQMKTLLQEYRAMMDDILNFSKETKTDKIAKNYHKQEEYNFTLFKYVNDLIAEMESFNDDLGFLHLDIDERTTMHEARTIQQRARLEELEGAFENIVNLTGESEMKLNEIDGNLKTMMQGIGTLFRLSKCQADPLVKLLGKNMTIEWYNVLLYLEILEKNVLELLLKVHYRDRILLDKKRITVNQMVLGEEIPSPIIYPIEKIVDRNPCPLCVEHEMVSDVVDVLQHVLDRKMTMIKLDERLQLPDGLARLHNVSHCHLPKSREIIQRRYEA